MAEKQKNELNEEQVLAFLQDIVGKIKSEEDPLELNAYRRLFRKAVPFTLRAYFAAYLLKQISAGKTPRMQPVSSRNDRSSRTGRRDRSDRGEERESRLEPRQRDNRESRGNRQEEPKRVRSSEPRQFESIKTEPRPVLADDVSTTLFISIGRNRRVYPRDLIGLIMQNVEMDREHIGDIRVLDNYSFVQVITEDAEKIIAALNEFEYRGRKLAVSYSRKKEESVETGESSGFETSSVPASDDEFDADAGIDSDQEIARDVSFSGDDESDLEDSKENNGNI